MFNIENFAASIGRTGVAKASHFMFIINVPSSQNKPNLTQNLIGRTFIQEVQKLGTTWETYGTTHIAFRCDRVSMPGRIVISSPYKEGNYGLLREYPTNVVYQPVDASIILSKNLQEKVFFELWQDLIVGHHRTQGDDFDSAQHTKDLNYLSNYTTSCTIMQFEELPRSETSGSGGDPTGLNPIYSQELIECYPRTIQDMQADWGSQEIQRLNVVFDYKYYKDKIHYEVDKRFATDGRRRFGRSTVRTGIEQGAAVLAGQVAARSGLTQRQQAFLTGATTAAVNIFKVGGNLAGGGGAVSRTTSTSVRDAINRNRVDVFTV